MSKTIDVEAGDTFAIETITGQVTQRRGERERVVDGTAVRDWLKASAPWSVTVPLSPRTADATFRHWGYSITTPAAKDEAPAKTEPTPDVPMVGDIWVEHDGVLSGYSQWNKMHALHGYEIRNGTARIVRLAPDAEAIKAVVREMMKDYNATDLNAREYAKEARDMAQFAQDQFADLAATVKRVEERVAKLEATTIRLDRPMEFGQGPATAICLAALRAVGVHDEEVNRE